MEKIEYQRLHEREYIHWWNIGRRRVLEAALARNLKFSPTERKVLDVGCGAGGNILFLKNFGRVTGFDISEEALSFSSDKGFSQLVLGRAEKMPFPNGSFGIVSALDCIEHIEDDGAALQEMHRVLKDDGILLLTVPAHRWLWSRHDEALHHKRRYTEKELRGKIQSRGFVLQEITHFVVPAIPFLLFQKSMRKIKKTLFPNRKEIIDTYDVLLPPPLNRALVMWLAVERMVMEKFPIPLGSSLLVVARKRGH